MQWRRDLQRVRRLHGGNAPQCTTDSCHTVGACVPATGCPAPVAKVAGTSCSDGNLCNGTETCNASGVCTAGTPLTCTGADACHTVGACVPATGCPAPVQKATGASCSDGNLCNGSETCNSSGACVAGTPLSCPTPNACQTGGACNPATGCPALVNKADYTPCTDDGNVCNGIETCQSGACVAEVPGTWTTCAGPTRVTFYQSFTGTTADIGVTGTTPQNANSFQQVAGLFGQAFESSGSPNADLTYKTNNPGANPTNLVFTKPGSLSFWIKPATQYGPTTLLVADDTNVRLVLGDDGTSLKATFEREGDSTTNATALLAGPPGWRADTAHWHLIVVNWSANGASLSLDGTSSPVVSPAWMRTFPNGPNRAARFTRQSLADGGGAIRQGRVAGPESTDDGRRCHLVLRPEGRRRRAEPRPRSFRQHTDGVQSRGRPESLHHGYLRCDGGNHSCRRDWCVLRRRECVQRYRDV